MEHSDRLSATSRAYRALERQIVTLDLAPGSVVTERALVERIGLGRTPVREALQRLAWEGLVEIRPRSGVAITPMAVSDWVRVIDARTGVETVIARAAARRATSGHARNFHHAALAMQRAVVAGNVMAFMDADKMMDEAMSEAADNVFAARTAAPLQTHSRRFWMRYQSDDGLAAAADGHVAIVKRVIEGDDEGAAEETQRLMSLLRRNALDAARD